MTYAELTQLIQDYTENSETSFVDNLPQIIKQAEERISHAVRSPDQRKDVFTSQLAGANEYMTPADFIEPLAISTSLSSVPLLLKSPSLLQSLFPGNGTRGTPIWYCIYQSYADGTTLLLIGPPPDTNCDIDFYYIGNPGSIVDDGSTWISRQFPQVLLYASLLEAAVYCKFSNDQIAMFQTRFDAAMATLKETCETFEQQDENMASPIRAA